MSNTDSHDVPTRASSPEDDLTGIIPSELPGSFDPGDSGTPRATDIAVPAFQQGQHADVARGEYSQKDIDNLKRTLDSCGYALSDFETDAMGGTSFTPVPSTANVSHQLDTLNRRIDAEYHTDVIRVKGHVVLNKEDPAPFTRIFEPIGDFVPNVLVGDQERGNVFLNPSWKTVIKKGEDNFRIAKTGSFAPPGFEKYLIVNGKTVFVKLVPGRDMPIFLTLRDCVEFMGADLRAVRVSATVDEMIKSAEVIDKPFTTSELFAQSLIRGKRVNRGVKQTQLFPYFKPTPEMLGDTEQAREFCSPAWSDVAGVCELKDSSYKEVLLTLIEQFQINLAPGDKEEDSLRSVWKSLTEHISGDLTEAEAKDTYFSFLDLLSDGKYDDDSALIPTGNYLQPIERADGMVVPMEVELHIDGRPYYVNALSSGFYNLLPPYTFMPEGACATLRAVLAAVPDLIKEGVCVAYGSYSATVEVLARSTTPRSEEGGDLQAKLKWFEPMTATVLYNGPIFRVGRSDEDWLKSWVVSLNSALLNGVLRHNLRTDCLEIMRPLIGKKAPLGNPAPHLTGVGLRRGQLVDCEVRDSTLKWNNHFCTDIRLRLPLDLIALLLREPDLVQLVDVESYLSNRSPLLIRTLGRDGKWIERVYNDRLSLKFESTEGRRYVLAQVIAKDPFKNILDEEEEVLDMTGSKGKSRATPSVVSATSSTPEYRASGRDYKEVKYFADKSLGYKPGDWDGLFTYHLRHGQKVDILRDLYTIHWLHANEGFTHPVTEKHHPLWSLALKGKPKVDERFRQRVPGRILGANPHMQINEEGCQAISEQNEEAFKKSKERRANNAQTWFAEPSYGFGNAYSWSEQPERGLFRGRGRAGPSRGRRPGNLDFLYDSPAGPPRF